MTDPTTADPTTAEPTTAEPTTAEPTTAEPTTAERALLQQQLSAQRAHVLGILDGLAPEQLIRPASPSGWSFAGMVNHLCVDVERFWFRGVLGGQAQPVGTDGFRLAAGRSAAEILADYRIEIARSEAVLASVPLDAPLAWWPDGLFGDWAPGSARQVALHVLAETACHAGHLDAAREALDGRQWLVLTEQAPESADRTTGG